MIRRESREKMIDKGFEISPSRKEISISEEILNRALLGPQLITSGNIGYFSGREGYYRIWLSRTSNQVTAQLRKNRWLVSLVS
jgi:hypothetical protein